MPYPPGKEAGPQLLTLWSEPHSSCQEAGRFPSLLPGSCPSRDWWSLTQEAVRWYRSPSWENPGARPLASLSLSFSSRPTIPVPLSCVSIAGIA